MTIRNVTSPAVIVTETDKSMYGQIPTARKTNVFVTGFASKGDDYATIDIASTDDFIQRYGMPTNDPERFLYYAVENVLNSGGNVCVSKLPYANRSKDLYPYVDYIINDQCIQKIDVISELSTADPTLTSYVEIDSKCMYSTKYNISKLDKTYFDAITNSINDVYNRYGKEFTVNTQLITTDTDKRRTLDEITSQLKATLSENTVKQKKLDSIISDVERIVQMTDDINTILDKNSSDDMSDPLDIYKQSVLQKMVDARDILNAEVMTYGDSSKLENIIDDIGKIFTMPSVALSSEMLELSVIDQYRTGDTRVPNNTIRIVDISRGKYDGIGFVDKQKHIHKHCECIGLLPVIITPANAMYVQRLIGNINELHDGQYDGIDWSAISDIQTFGSTESMNISETSLDMHIQLYDVAFQSVSRLAADEFPAINDNVTDTTLLDGTYLKHIGIAVFEIFKTIHGKIGFRLVESYTGSLDPSAKDSDGHSCFIDDVVNSNSYRINVFTNCLMSRFYREAKTLVCANQVGMSLGLKDADCQKTIDYKLSLIDPLNKIFEKNKNIDERVIDIVLDAGISNFGQMFQLPNPYGRTNEDVWVSEDVENFNWLVFPNSLTKDVVSSWKTIIQKFDEFCRLMRKDCIFIADSLRGYGLDGNSKILNKHHPEKTFENTLVPYIDVLAAVNSNYSLGYCGWLNINCPLTGDRVWCPPSVKAVANYVTNDRTGYVWDTCAGLTRGTLAGINECAIDLDQANAGKLYSASWNYVMRTYNSGHTLEGIKTFQLAPTALSRVPVRRLLLWLERSVRLVAKRFIYEQNTDTARAQFVASIDPYFKTARLNGGISEYKIICDETNNTPTTIDNNELNVTIKIKPIHSIEWILVTFVCVAQSASISESLSID